MATRHKEIDDKRREFFPENYVRRSAKILRLLSEENRLRIMLYLAKEGPVSVGEISEVLEINQTTLSHHLSLLRNADLVMANRDGKNVYYDVNEPMWREMGLKFFTYLRKGDDIKFLDRFVLRRLRK